MHRRFRSFLTASGTRAACLLAALACGAALRAGELASADLRPLFARWGLDARRQGKRGTCSVFVITGAIEFAKAKTRGSSERLSVEFLNWAANVTHGDQKDGGFFADLWNGFTAHGICPEEDMPYRDEFDPKREPGEFARDQGSQAHALGLGLRWIKAWNPRKGVNAAQLAEIKRTLLRGWPVAGGFLWPKDPQWDDGVLRMCPRPEVRDGHSVLLVGFVDDPVKPGGGTFIIRDSNRDDPDERLTYEYVSAYMNDAVSIEGPAGAAAGGGLPYLAPGAFLARPLPLWAVRLTGGPLKNAQDLDAKYLLALEPDRMLAHLRRSAGLEPKAAGYGGWDSGDGKQLTGHIAGHYLSAVSLMYAATGDARFKDRADYLVGELAAIQDAHGDGYIGAQKDAKGVDGKTIYGEVARGDIRSSGFDLNGLWSPWYVQHKLYAGLRDAYRFTGNRTALEVEIKFAAWAEKLLAGLDDAKLQRMLDTEFGGMNEVAADLAHDTGDARWMALAGRFEHRAVVEPLARGRDILGGKHGNTLVPKLMGELARFVYAGEEKAGAAARFFWDRVAHHHSFATGGHGRNEYFGRPDRLNDMVDGRTAETCNVYNMVKMARTLFALEPDIRYADFHERALFNHVLGSMDPAEGWTCYMVPVGRGVTREYERNMLGGGFTCCVGTGMESHALHAYGLYYESDDTLWVNLYAPSTAAWSAAGVALALETDFPEGESAALTVNLAAPRRFTLALRRPYWAGAGFRVEVNGEPVADLPAPGSYVKLARTWRNGDRVALALPKALRLEPLPDNPRRAAVLWGPLVLAGDLGAEETVRSRGRRAAAGGAEEAVPVLLAAGEPIENWLKPVPGKPGVFRTDGVGRSRDVEFLPFYRLHRRAYAAYWDFFTPEEWARESAGHGAAQEAERKLAAATVAFVQPGEMQPEIDFNFQGEEAVVARVLERAARRGAKWFSFDLPVDESHPMALIVTYGDDERQRRTFDILVDGVRVGVQAIERRTPERDPRLFDVEYKLPPDAVRGKTKVTVRFQAAAGAEIAAVCGLRMIRADAER